MDNRIKKIPVTCPSCVSPLRVAALRCGECGTEIHGDFDLPLFLKLGQREQEFIMEFVKTSGSLKDMAKVMGVSYPTVRNYLDELIDKITKTEQR